MSDVSGDQGVEAKLLDGYTELGELSFVSLDHVGVGLANLLELGLDLLNRLVLKVFYLLQGTLYYTQSFRIDFGGSQ